MHFFGKKSVNFGRRLAHIVRNSPEIIVAFLERKLILKNASDRLRLIFATDRHYFTNKFAIKTVFRKIYDKNHTSDAFFCKIICFFRKKSVNLWSNLRKQTTQTTNTN